MQPEPIIRFWAAAGPAAWFTKSAAFDQQIRDAFEPAHHAAARGEFMEWLGAADGALGLLLLLDQFPRNLFRGSAHAFATDPLARMVASRAIEQGFDAAADPLMRPFYYLPFEHSEAMADQDRSIVCFEAAANDPKGAENLHWARLHRDIIVRFGRFPHRNAALGRTTTEAEQAFLDDGGFAG